MYLSCVCVSRDALGVGARCCMAFYASLSKCARIRSQADTIAIEKS